MDGLTTGPGFVSTPDLPTGVCVLCGHTMTTATCGWGHTSDGPLCHTDDHDCYTRWTLRGERPDGPIARDRRCWLSDGPVCPDPDRCCLPPAPAPLPAHADPRGDGLCPECPTDLSSTPTGSHCIECGWTSPETP